MERKQIAPGVHLSAMAGEKFKRYKINLHFVLPGRRKDATALAVLPHILERRCATVPDARALSLRLFDLYGAELTGESYTAGPNRVVTLGITGLRDSYALNGEALSAEGLALLLDLAFGPVVENGAFAAEDVSIEMAKQADYLRNERSDKRGYCLRQARRKLYGDSPLGVESAGYLEDMEKLTAADIYAAYTHMLQTAAIEVVLCGADEGAAAQLLEKRLAGVQRTPVQPAALVAAEGKPALEYYDEGLDTAQGKLALLFTSGVIRDAAGDAVMRLANAALGGTATSRLFQNVREKQSLCYYCASNYGAFSGTLQLDSGVDHENAQRAAEAILEELHTMQQAPISAEELENARRALQNGFKAATDSPDAMVNWQFNEWLRGTCQSLAEAATRLEAVTAEQVRDALASFVPAVEYRIIQKEAGV